LIYSEAGVDARFVNVDVIEVHDARCGGDPTVWRRRDSFRVNRMTHEVLYYDVTTGDYSPLEIELQRRSMPRVARPAH
jgi:hypothetical protein